MEWNEIYTRLNADREDGQAWQALGRRVRAWAHAHLGDKTWHSLEDVVADTCSSVAVGFDRARGEATFAGFVYGCYLNERRRVLGLRRGQSTCLSLDEPDLLPSVGQPDVAVEDPSVVWEILLRLPARQRAAVTLRHLEGLSAEDIAAHLGVSPVNARQLVHKGLLALRRQLSMTTSV